SGGAMVSTKWSPRRARRRAGMVRRPLSSRECSYCPVNLGKADIPQPLYPTENHFAPLYRTIGPFASKMKGAQVGRPRPFVRVSSLYTRFYEALILMAALAVLASSRTWALDVPDASTLIDHGP